MFKWIDRKNALRTTLHLYMKSHRRLLRVDASGELVESLRDKRNSDYRIIDEDVLTDTMDTVLGNVGIKSPYYGKFCINPEDISGQVFSRFVNDVKREIQGTISHDMLYEVLLDDYA